MLIYDVRYVICNYAAKVQKNCNMCKFFDYRLEFCILKNNTKAFQSLGNH